MDLIAHRGQDYLITVDYLSGYFEVDRVPSKRVSDITYALRFQFACHGIPLEVMSDNSPFGAQKILDFAAAWEFKTTTSSPRYAQNNGKAESAVKTAKRLMTKASESGLDPFLAILAFRNTPSAQLGLAPTQIMFGRRSRTLLPTVAALLTPPTSAGAQEALTAAKTPQTCYYDKRAKPRPTLSAGATVRARFDEQDWGKAQVSRILPFRSYELRFEDGSTRRRTSRHVHASAEPPIITKTQRQTTEPYCHKSARLPHLPGRPTQPPPRDTPLYSTRSKARRSGTTELVPGDHQNASQILP